MARVDLLQALVLVRVVISRERIIQARDETLHRPMRELLGVDVAIHVVRFDHADRLLQLGGVDLPGRVVREIRQDVGESLVRVDAEAKAEADAEHRYDHDGNAPQGVARLHASRLAEATGDSIRPTRPARYASGPPSPHGGEAKLAAEPDAGISRVVVDANLNMQMRPG